MKTTNEEPATQPKTKANPSHTLRLYRRALREGSNDESSSIRACWFQPDKTTPETLLKLIEQLETASTTVSLKADRRTRVMNAHLLGYNVIIKSYKLTKPLEKLTYFSRVSPARRFWATARTMQQLNLPTPLPLGYVEVYSRGIPIRSYVINEFIPDAIMSRQWIEPEFHKQTSIVRATFRSELLLFLRDLYANGLYHKDTKCENILLKQPFSPTNPTFMWIDLECCQCKTPTQHDIIRNLVQINGAIGLNVRREDRLLFLDELAQHYPWANRPATIKRICSWTRKRLEKEKHHA